MKYYRIKDVANSEYYSSSGAKRYGAGFGKDGDFFTEKEMKSRLPYAMQQPTPNIYDEMKWTSGTKRVVVVIEYDIDESVLPQISPLKYLSKNITKRIIGDMDPRDIAKIRIDNDFIQNL